jgi:hypothetical protein
MPRLRNSFAVRCFAHKNFHSDNAPLQQSFTNFSALQQSAQGTSLQQQPFYLIGNPAPANVFAGVVTPQPVALVVDPSMLQNLSLQIQGLPQAAFGQPLLPTGTLMIGGINQMTCLSPLFLPVPRSSPPVDSGNSNLLLLQHALAGVSPIFSTSGLQEANIQSIGLAQDCNPAVVGQLSMNQATYNSPRGTFVVDLATSNTNTGSYAAQRIISEAAGLSHQALQIHEDSGQYSDHVPGFTLYMKCDDENISRYQCLVRQQIELFAASEEDIDSNAQGRNKPIVLGQVGIRCRHCSKIPPRHRTRGATYYPAKLTGLYQAAQNMASAHLCNHCQHIPDALRRNLIALRDRKSSAGGGKQYWADGVRVLGVIESDGVLLLGPSRHIGDMSNEPSDADKQTVKEKHKNPARESDA